MKPLHALLTPQQLDWLINPPDTPRHFDHQRVQLERHLGELHNLLLAGEPGTGKTRVAITLAALYAAALKNHRTWAPAVYVCPANLLRQVARDFRSYAPWLRVVMIAKGSDRIPPAGSYDVLVVSYSLPVATRTFAALLAKAIPAMVLLVLDESHQVRTVTALRTRFWVNLARRARTILPMSGTAVVNSAEDLFVPLMLLGLLTAPGIAVDGRAPTFAEFCARFVHYQTVHVARNRAIAKPVGTKNAEVLQAALAPRITRWIAAELLSLPELLVETHYLDVGDVRRQVGTPQDQAVLDDILQRYVAGDVDVLDDLEAMPLESLSTYRRLIGEAKALPIAAWVADRLEAGGGQTLVFGHHRAVLEVITQSLREAGVAVALLYGGVSLRQRDDAVLAFQEGRVQVLVLQIEVAGLGLNLQAASHVVFAELPWTAAAYSQAVARAHRAGQDKHVLVSIATVADSLDEAIAAAIQRKARLAATILDR